MKDLLVGLDIGTSSIKGGLFDLEGRAIALSKSSQVVLSPQSGWAEQDPTQWWMGVQQTLQSILIGFDPARIAAVGLCGQCPGHVLLQENGDPIGNAIIWRDQRAWEEANWLCKHISPEQSQRWAGMHFTSDPTLPPARLLWLKNHLPENWYLAKAVLQPKDFIAFKLTGVLGTDPSSAYGLAHPDLSNYDPEYFQTLKIPMQMMPPILEGPTSVLGMISPYAAQSTGLLAGTLVVIGTIDAWCDNLAGGIVLENQAVDVSGTSEIVSLGIDAKVSGENAFLAHLGKDIKFLVGPTQAGGDTLRWLVTGFYPEMDTLINFSTLESEALRVSQGSQGLVFLPYLNGERAPIWDVDAQACFIGLTLEHTRAHCVRSVYEGVAFAVRHILNTFETITQKQAEYLVTCGGGSRSCFWNQVKADVLQRPVIPTAINESACLGAAILAGVGIGLFSNLQIASKTMIRYQDPLEPDFNMAEQYERNFRIYLGAYPALKNLFQIKSEMKLNE